MDHCPVRRPDDDSDRVHNGMLHLEEFYLEFSQPQFVRYRIYSRGLESLGGILLEVLHFLFNEGQSEIASYDKRIVQVPQKKRGSPNVVKMTMTENHSPDVLLPALEAADVRDDIVDSRHILFWKHHSHIQDDNVTVIFEQCHIPSHLFVSSQWSYAKMLAPGIFLRSTLGIESLFPTGKGASRRALMGAMFSVLPARLVVMR